MEFNILAKELERMAVDADLAPSEAGLLAAIPSVKLPTFASLSAEQLAAIRVDDEGFREFRKEVLSACAFLGSAIGKPGFQAEIVRVERDLLTPAIDTLIQEAKRSRILREALRDSSAQFGIGVLGALTLAKPIEEAAGGAAVASLLRLLWSILKSPDVPAASRFALNLELESHKT